MKFVPLLLLSTLGAAGASAAVSSPELTLGQLNHRAFTAAEGSPTDIDALAQTSDGTLWIGGRTGLTRFDGVRFVPYPGPSEEPLNATNVSSLLATPDGGLWIAFRPGGVSLLKNGHLTRYRERDGLPDGTVEQFARDRDGSMWAAARLGLAHLRGERWETIVDEPELGTPYGVLVDRAGTLWVATVNGLFARAPGERHFRAIDRRRYFSPGGVVLAASPDGTIWAAAERELIRVDRVSDPQPGGVVAIRGISGGPLLLDAGGNLWAWDLEATSLLRVPFRDLTPKVAEQAILHPERVPSDASNPGRVFALLEDREGNIWVGTNTALHRFSQSNVVRDVAPPCMQGVLTTDRSPLAAGEDGGLWIACKDGSVTHVDEIRDGVVLSRQPAPEFTAAYRDPQGTVWFGGPTALGHLERGRIVTTPLPLELSGRPIQALMRDRGGGMWVSVTRKGTFRFIDGQWSEYGGLDALPRGAAYVEAIDDSGTLWFGYPNSRIARVRSGVVKLFDATRGLDVGNVLAVLPKDGEIWVGGELGFARFEAERFVSVRSSSGAPLRGVSGIVSARNGDLWLNGIGGISHIARREVERVVRDPTHALECETFNYLDGVPGTAVQLRPQPSAIETSDGRVWFSMTAGIISIDATELVHNAQPPPVTIWSLSSGPQRYASWGANLRLPVNTSELQIEYSAGSLTVPERVHFRYKLEGLDRNWRDVGTRREALYTNLVPGTYTFRVTASNNDGVWNNTGASLSFIIPPAFYQTTWFYVLCGLVCLLIVAALYRVRVRQVAAQVRGRLEARLSERERIARELHDTLLQGVQGLIWRFQAVAERIPASEPARQLMEQALERADKLLGEGRDRVKDLRPAASEVADLAEAFAMEGEQLAQLRPVRFRVSLQGASRDLHPIVREEGFLIGREALCNAFQHANAANIEAEVTYGARALHVRIRDDGQGMSATVLGAGGRPGHFGLIGMRERAKKLGGHFEVWSHPGAGTEVDLRIPAQVAYRRSQKVSGRPLSWLAGATKT